MPGGIVPGRIDHDMVHLVREKRRLRLRLADDRAGAVDDVAVAPHHDLERRRVDEDMLAAEVARHEAPELHVGEDLRLLGRRTLAEHGAAGSGREHAIDRQAGLALQARDLDGDGAVVERRSHRIETEPRADQRHARVAHADAQRRAVGDLVGGPGDGTRGPRLGERAAERGIFGMGRIEACSASPASADWLRLASTSAAVGGFSDGVISSWTCEGRMRPVAASRA